ncbi:MAG: hypothetical protein DRR04_03710 [Gammaproteobacteria bacterium]|nr:MAG: hypothetical protein DRQ97_05030 [Gammaproteobacteria bacterium]RLA61153.1 MAG: hypothetical protein DRR04_03710 [Gammaproteobacteria bacterium]
MSDRSNGGKRPRWRSIRVWHRYLGGSAALCVLILAITGIPLNHTEPLELDSRYIQSNWILDRYGIQAPQAPPSYRAGDHRVTLMGDNLYLGRRKIEGIYRQLGGAVLFRELLVIAVGDNLLLLTPQGEVIERLGGAGGVPGGIKRIGIESAEGRLVVDSSAGRYHSDANFLHWRRRADKAGSAIEWAVPTPLEATLKVALDNQFRGAILPVERVLLDLHSGRFFGSAGPWIMDAAAVALLMLAISGSWTWFKRRG